MYKLKIKKLLFFLILTNFIFFGINAQEIISTCGDYEETISGSISWTIGEPVIETFSNETNILTQGFQQSKLTVTNITENQFNGIEINAFPNPTNDFILVKTKTNNKTNMDICLFDLKGNLIFKQKMINKEQNIKMNNYNSGTYILKITENNKEIKTFQIIKY